MGDLVLRAVAALANVRSRASSGDLQAMPRAKRLGSIHSRDVTMPLEALIGIGFAALVVLALALRKLVEWISFPCQFCEAKVRPFHKVDTETQEVILRYFRNHERREAPRKRLFVCLNCKTVHDDFSTARSNRGIATDLVALPSVKCATRPCMAVIPKTITSNAHDVRRYMLGNCTSHPDLDSSCPQKAQRFSGPAEVTLMRRVAPTQPHIF